MKPTGISLGVRAAGRQDAEAIARLAGELGYPSTADDARERLESVEANPAYATFVAVDHGDEVLGWIQLAEVRTLAYAARAEITGLVVDSQKRGAGAGRALVERGEQWARERGLTAIGLRSNVVREDAHGFYLRLGYTVTKSQKVFRKPL